MTIHFGSWYPPCSELEALLLLGGDFALEGRSVSQSGCCWRPERGVSLAAHLLLPMTLDNQTWMPLNAPGGDYWQGAEGNLHLSISLSLSVSSRSTSCRVITHKLTNCTHCCQCQGRMHKTEDRVKAEQHGGQCSSPVQKYTMAIPNQFSPGENMR